MATRRADTITAEQREARGSGTEVTRVVYIGGVKPGSKDTEWKRDPVRVTWVKKFRCDVSLLSFGD